MKIVLDTNVIFSALHSKRGALHKLLVWLFKNDKHCSVVSNSLVLEYIDVLTRDDSMNYYEHLDRDDICLFVDSICSISYHQEIHFLWRPFLKDIKDDMVLEVAVNANADAIVTFNLKDFRGVSKKFGIEVIKPKDFLKKRGIK